MKVMCTVKLQERLPYPLLTIKECFVRVVRKHIEHQRQQRGEKAAQSHMIFRIHQQIDQMGCCLENETSEQKQLQVIPVPPRNARQIRVDEETKGKLIDARKILIKGHEDTLTRLEKKLQKVAAKGPNSFEVKRVEIEMREINTRVSKLRQQLADLQP